MNIDIDWQEPIKLTYHKKMLVDENALPEKIKNTAGVYFFSRKYGDRYEPFYIGETLKLKIRLGQHLKTKKLAFVLLGMSNGPIAIKGGERYFHFGYFRSKQGQSPKKCIKIVQKYLIREALAKNLALLNLNLTTFRTDTITFSGTTKARAIYGKQAKVEA